MINRTTLKEDWNEYDNDKNLLFCPRLCVCGGDGIFGYLETDKIIRRFKNGTT